MKELLFTVKAEDCEFSYFKGSGDGGQARQKTSSGVQIIHRPSGAMARCSETRSQLQNKKIAWKRLGNSIEMKRWIQKKVAEIDMGKSIEQYVDEQMKPENLKIEAKKNGKWAECQEKDLTNQE